MAAPAPETIALGAQAGTGCLHRRSCYCDRRLWRGRERQLLYRQHSWRNNRRITMLYQCVIDSEGQLGTISSSRRFKREIKAMEQASESILALKPVTFHYKSDNTGTPQFGLIAEEVAEVNPDLVVRDKNGEIYTVRYDAVNAMLLNEFLKEHRKNEQREATIAQVKSTVAQQQKDFQATVTQQQKQIETLTAELREQAARNSESECTD